MNALTRARRAADMTQTDLAAQVKISRSHLSQLETGAKRATANTLSLLEEALGLEAGALDELRDTTAAERGRKGAAARLRNAAERANQQPKETEQSHEPQQPA